VPDSRRQRPTRSTGKGHGATAKPTPPARPSGTRAPSEPETSSTTLLPARRFPFRFEPLLLPVAAAVGVLPGTSHVEVDGAELRIRFGPWSLATPRSNVAGTAITGPYQLLKVVGPPRISLADRGVTFATNRHSGLCIRFHEPVAAALPFGLVHHPAATVTVEDPAALADVLSRT
jgi:hypothetical protein